MGSTTTAKTWLVTGASQGLGLAMVLSALEAGHKVIACARNPTAAAAAHPEVEEKGGRWLQLDVTSRDTQHIVREAVEAAGGLDVVINNAGYYQGGPIEDLDEDEMQLAMDTLFWGPIRVLKGVLPAMRARRSGVIIGIGSIYGFYNSMPGASMYSCSKAAFHMLHTILGKDLQGSGIRIHTIIAGTYRTLVVNNSKIPKDGVSQHYLSGPVGGLMQKSLELLQGEPWMPGSPQKFGDRVVEIVDGTGYGKGLENVKLFLFGNDAIELSAKQLEEYAKDFAATDELARSTDVEGTTSRGAGLLADI